eukprot:CAMPEP_0176163588 /NCGR_PEP_ID=MMETSP0120_2-20121206/83694_1 /TAXON_ID=160619 /ORGANISM="Kryptoperidinium foliaceum, Strain CCMP 1326" /LENGTH=121 /DNA_ID=CAMNT_0017501121 /DNA_START=104 /DNA_END=469 /DNA_ORIENTATION=+
MAASGPHAVKKHAGALRGPLSDPSLPSPRQGCMANAIKAWRRELSGAQPPQSPIQHVGLRLRDRLGLGMASPRRRGEAQLLGRLLGLLLECGRELLRWRQSHEHLPALLAGWEGREVKVRV